MSNFDWTDLDGWLDGLDEGTMVEQAISLALRDARYSGEHHKQWVIDQMLRILTGSAYERVIENWKRLAREDDWWTGIAP